MMDYMAAIEASRLGPATRQAAILRLIERKKYAEIVKITGVNRARIREIEASIKRRAGKGLG